MLQVSQLHPHPSRACSAITSLQAHTRALADGGVRLYFELLADMSSLRIPEWQGGGYADDLWQHTCFEAFITTEASTAYREFNFSPSGQWATYAFTDYRQRDMRWQPTAALLLHRKEAPGSLALEVTLSAELLPATDVNWQIGLTAVIETTDSALSYWALTHPSERPDFHQRASFTLSLAPHIELP